MTKDICWVRNCVKNIVKKENKTMKKIDLFEISMWWFIIICILVCIACGGLILYFIWFMLPFHWIFKILITLTFIAGLIIAKGMADYKTVTQISNMHKENEDKNINN